MNRTRATCPGRCRSAVGRVGAGASRSPAQKPGRRADRRRRETRAGRHRRLRLRQQRLARHRRQPRPVHQRDQLAGAAGKPDRHPADARPADSAPDDHRESGDAASAGCRCCVVPARRLRRRRLSPGGGGGRPCAVLRSTARLRRRPGRPGRLHLLRRLETRSGRRRDAKEKASSAVTAATTSRRCRSSSPTARRRGCRRRTARWQIVEPVAGGRRRGRAVVDHRQPGDARHPAGGRDERRRPGAVRPEPPRIDVAFRVKGQKEPRRIAVRRQDADRRRALRRAARPDARVPGVVVPRFDVQQGHVRAARQDDPGVRARKVDRLETRRAAAPSMQFAKNGDRLVDRQAVRRRAPTSAPSRARSSGCRRRQMQGIAEPTPADLKRYGLDQPTRDDDRRQRQLARATLTLGGTENARAVRQGCVAADGVHRRADAARRRLQGHRRLPPQGPVRLAIVHGRRASSSAAAARPSCSRRPRAPTARTPGRTPPASDVDTDQGRRPADPALRHPRAVVRGRRAPVAEDAGADGGRRLRRQQDGDVTFGRAGAEVFASRADEPGSAKVEPTAFDETIKALDAVK